MSDPRLDGIAGERTTHERYASIIQTRDALTAAGNSCND